MEIFLSYNREDRVVAERFALALEARGHHVWWDAGLKAGEAYDEVTEAALRGARAVLVLWSPRSVVSRWVRAEATVAQRLKTLVPVMIEPCERPVMFELTQTADLSHWTGAPRDPAWLAFLEDLDALLAAPRAPVTEGAGAAAGASATVTPLPSARPGAGRAAVSRRRTLVGAGAAAAVAAVAAAGGFAWFGTRKPRATAPPNTLAVLPFRNISQVPDQDYFSEGLSAELRAALIRNPELQVAAPASSRSAVGSGKSPAEIARQLGVAFLLEGSVAKAAGQVRVGVDLIDAVGGLTRWSQTYERPLDNIFAVQSEIARLVAEALRGSIGPSGKPDLTDPASTGAGPGTGAGPDAGTAVGGSASVGAFDDFLRGREAYGSAQSAATDREALAWFDQAIEKDPRFAAAHAWRARALSVLAAQSEEPVEVRRLREDAITSARTAVRLAPDFALAHTTLGWVQFNLGLDARSASTSFGRARVLAPGDADVLMACALFNARIGHAAAARPDSDRALVLDPLNPSAFRIAGTVSTIAGQLERAVDEFERALGLSPGASVLNAFRADALVQLGRLDEARNGYLAEPNEIFKITGLSIVDWKQGRQGEARGGLDRLKASFGNSTLYQQGQILAQMAQLDDALAALELAYTAGDAGLAQLATDYFLVPLRGRPRFQALRTRIGFD